MSHIIYGIGTRVQWPSMGNLDYVFTGTITGYSKDALTAFIRDDGRTKPRPVTASRIRGRAPNPEPHPHIPDLIA